MSPAEVPDALVEKAIAAAFRMPDGYAEAHPGIMSDLKAAYGDQYRAALAAVLPEIQAQALMDFADGLPSDWKRPNGPADAARAHAEHLLECTCAEAERRITREHP